MASVKLGEKAVGDIVKLNVDGVATEFIIVHQGKPGEMYDDSCDGTWLLMKDVYETCRWNSNYLNDYGDSYSHIYLNSTFLNLFDTNIQEQIKQVYIPYRPGNSSFVRNLQTKIFFLSAYEVGFNTTHRENLPKEGTKLDYFEGNVGTSEKIAYLNGTPSDWWLRSANISSNNVWHVGNGWPSSDNGSKTSGSRPALILPPSSFWVSDDGTASINTAPVITSGTADGADLGVKSDGFDLGYTVDDEDGDAVTVSEYLDGVLQRAYPAPLGQPCAFQAVDAAHWQTVLNGPHTLKIVANDGKEDSGPFTATFTKSVTRASITLAQPLPADDRISVAVLSVAGEIPEGAALRVWVTNNGGDDAPVWEDATAAVRGGSNHVFANQTAAKGFAFNFRVEVERGGDGQGGSITGIGGAFE